MNKFEYNNQMLPQYTIIRSKRRSLAIQINPQGELIVRSPLRLNIWAIEDFIMLKRDWINKHQESVRIQNQNIRKMNPEDIQQAKIKLYQYIIPRIEMLIKWKNLPTIQSIKITTSKWRWGSCSSKNGLCFSYRLIDHIGTPFIDAIIIHELAHLIEKNHQKPFWDLVYSWMPDYEKIIRATQHSPGEPL